MSALAAKTYGLVDEVLETRAALSPFPAAPEKRHDL
jgi:ATP-dependent Clp protease protease subunit